MPRSVLILGGGLTGLTAARQFCLRGDRVTVMEGGEQPGGLAQTLAWNGFRFDLGPHEFCTTHPRLVEILQSLLGEGLLRREKKACQFYRGQYLTYPFTPRDILKIGLPFTARVCRETLAARLKSLYWETHDYSFEKWTTRRFGKTLYRSYFGPYTEKVWGVDPDTLDARTASDRIAFNSIFDLALKTFDYFVLGRDDYSSIHSPLKHSFYYAQGGIGGLIEALTRTIEEAGATIRTRSRVCRLETDGDRVVAAITETGEQVSGFDILVSTIPLPDLLACLQNTATPSGIRYRSMVFVFLEIPRTGLTKHHWIYYPDPDIVFQRLTDFTHFDAGMVPEGSTGLCLEISCFTGDPTWNLGDDEIVRRCLRDLARVGVVDERESVRAHVVRRSHVYPLQVVGYIEMVRTMLEVVDRHRNLASIGRQGLYKYSNMNECMEIAIDAVEQIASGPGPYQHRLEPRWKGAGLESERPAARRPL